MPDQVRPEPALEAPIEALISDATALAQHLVQYQQALTFVCVAEAEEVRARILALTYLLEPLDRSREEVLSFSGLTKGTLAEMEARGLIKFNGPRVHLTQFGESFLALLSMFNKSLEGSLSEGFIDLTQAVVVGRWPADFVARLVIGAARRQARGLREVTHTQSAAELERSRAQRDIATSRVHKVVDLLQQAISPDLAAELRSAGTELNHAAVHQRQVGVRIVREDVLLPQGKRYSDLEAILKRHTWTSFCRAFQDSALIIRFPTFSVAADLDESLKHAFAPREREEPIARDLVKPEAGAPPAPIAFQNMLDDLANARDGDSWHLIAKTTRSYLSGVYYANETRLPREIRELGITFEWRDDARVHQEPFLDSPMVIVRRASA